MSKFENIEPKDITIWVNPVTKRITAKVQVYNEFHEVAFPMENLNMQKMIDSLKEDLRESKGPA